MSELLLAPPSSPEQAHQLPSVEAIPGTGVVNSVRVDVPRAKGEQLAGGLGTIDFANAAPFAIAENTSLGMRQSLIAVVSVNEESAVGVIRVSHNGQDVLALSQMKKNTEDTSERAKLLTIVGQGSSFDVGRELLRVKDGHEDRTISRQHFTVTMGVDGLVTIEDRSTNGTELISFVASEQLVASVAPKGIFKFLKKSKPSEGQTPEHEIEKQTSISQFITDLKGWSIKSSEVAEAIQPHQAKWNYTLLPEEIIKRRGALRGYEEPYVNEEGREMPAKYKGRKVISRDSNINGGVYIVPGGQEAIVVDDSKKEPLPGEKRSENNYDKAFDIFYQKLAEKKVRIEDVNKEGNESKVAEAAFESALELLQYDKDFADEIRDEYKDQKINLDVFLSARKGVCRHQALLTAYYIERFIADGKMNGKISVDRNIIPDRGGHAWARYTAPNGVVYIMDPAQKFFGTLQESRHLAEWNYARPDDKLY